MATKVLKIEVKAVAQLLWQHRELFIWLTALVMLYTADLHSDFTLCIPSHLGFENCPGCGLGHSITAAMHGNWALSLHYHILGIGALVVLSMHTIKLARNLITEIQQHYG